MKMPLKLPIKMPMKVRSYFGIRRDTAETAVPPIYTSLTQPSIAELWWWTIVAFVIVNVGLIATRIWWTSLQFRLGVFGNLAFAVLLYGGAAFVLGSSGAAFILHARRRLWATGLIVLTVASSVAWWFGSLQDMYLAWYRIPAPQTDFDRAVSWVNSTDSAPDLGLPLPPELRKLSLDGKVQVGDRGRIIDFRLGAAERPQMHYVYSAGPKLEDLDRMPQVVCGSWKRGDHWYLVLTCDWDD